MDLLAHHLPSFPNCHTRSFPHNARSEKLLAWGWVDYGSGPIQDSRRAAVGHNGEKPAMLLQSLINGKVS
jgi:hypothetical protein